MKFDSRDGVHSRLEVQRLGDARSAAPDRGRPEGRGQAERRCWRDVTSPVGTASRSCLGGASRPRRRRCSWTIQQALLDKARAFRECEYDAPGHLRRRSRRRSRTASRSRGGAAARRARTRSRRDEGERTAASRSISPAGPASASSAARNPTERRSSRRRTSSMLDTRCWRPHTPSTFQGRGLG